MNPNQKSLTRRTMAALLAIAVGISLTACHKESQPLKPPATEIRNVRDAYHGVEVDDPYRWLEDWSDPAVKAWSDAQNAYARAFLDRLPGVPEITTRVKEVVEAASVSYYSLTWRPGKLFAVKSQPPLNQPLLVVMDSADEPATEKVVLDLNGLDASGGKSMDWYVPSPDGSLVGVSLSAGGSESGDVHVFDVETGGALADIIPRVNGGTAGGDMAWSPDGKGFYYTRYPRAGERPAEDLDFFQQVWYHELGAPGDKDRYVVGRDLPRIAEIKLAMDSPSGRLLVTVQDGDSGRFSHYLVEPGDAAPPDRSAAFDDGVVEAAWGHGERPLPHLPTRRAPRPGPASFARRGPARQGRRPRSRRARRRSSRVSGRRSWPSLASRLYVTYQLGGPSEVRAFALDGTASGPTRGPAPFQRARRSRRSTATLCSSWARSYVEPPAWYGYDPASGETAEDRACFDLARRFLGRGGRPGVRRLERRHQGPRGHHQAQGPGARRHAPPPCSTATADTGSTCPPVSAPCAASGSSRAWSTPWPSPAAAASSARSGTGPAR